MKKPGQCVSDPFAVAVVRAGVTVGHVPRKISTVCSVFLRRSGSEPKAVVYWSSPLLH